MTHRAIALDRHPVVPVQFGFQGWFTIELIDAKTQVVKQRLRFRNLITDAGLDYIGTNTLANVLNVGNGYCAVGTGSTAPANSDTTLVAEIATPSTNRTSSNGGFGATTAYVAGPPDYWNYIRTYLFTETQSNGNLTELGIFTANTGGTLWTRQLLKDSGGTPTTVVKTSSDQLRVIYELRIQPPQADTSNSVTISGTSYTVVVRPANASSATEWGVAIGNSWFADGNGWARAVETNTLGARTSQPAGTKTIRTSTSFASYTNGNFYRDVTSIWDPGTANFATGIGSVVFMEMNNQDWIFQVGFTPKFAKDNTKRLTLIIRVSWTRV